MTWAEADPTHSGPTTTVDRCRLNYDVRIRNTIDVSLSICNKHFSAEIGRETNMDEKARDIGRILQQARKSRGFTQAEVAPQLGVSRATIAQIETGRRLLKAGDLRRLAGFYGCSPSELLAPAPSDQEIDGVAELFRSHPALAEDQGPSSFAHVWAMARALTELEAKLEVDSIAHPLPVYGAERANTQWQAARQGYRVAEDERRRLALGEGPVRFVDELLMTSGVRSAKATLPTGIISVYL